MKRKILYMLLSCIICFVFCIEASASVGNVATEDEDTGLAVQDLSNDAYNKLLLSFADGNTSQMEKTFPDYYAGAYINDTGKLVVMITDALQSEKNDLMLACENDEIIFEHTNHAYNELYAIKELIDSKAKYVIESGLYDCSYVFTEIRDNENKVFIGLESVENIELIMFLTDGLNQSSYQLYEKSVIPEECGGTVEPGDRIYGDSAGTIGFKARITINGTNKVGFVTACHVANGGDVYGTSSHIGNKIGDLVVDVYDQERDAAFLELTTSYDMDTMIDGLSVTEGTMTIPAIGSTVYMEGATSGHKSSTVISNINTFTMQGIGGVATFKNHVQTTQMCESGDSGGIVYTKSGSKYKVVGIIKGGDDEYSYVVKATYLPWTISVIS